MRTASRVLCLGLALGAPADAQTGPEPVRDNSFLLEEAYNQEAGVVQHISLFVRSRETGDWAYAFTQEWPATTWRHQLGYTLILCRVGGAATHTGPGDLAVNYRLQLAGGEGGAVAVAPRVTLLIPTGSASRGLGAGGVGLQANLPVSWQPSRALVTHWNAGAILTPRARNLVGERARTVGLNLGQSVIWLVMPSLNFVVETAWTREEDVTGPGRRAATEQLVIAPGVRAALNLPRGLQVVPGVAFPIGVGRSRGQRSVALYLSFEHPFRRADPARGRAGGRDRGVAPGGRRRPGAAALPRRAGA